MGAGLARLGNGECARAIRAEILEVSVADEPPLSGRTLGDGRVALEHLVEERRRPAEQREGRGGHPDGLVRVQLREAPGALVVDGDLAVRETERIDLEHRRNTVAALGWTSPGGGEQPAVPW